MDSFSIIQNFFTRMRCHYCAAHLHPAGIQLVRKEGGVYVVNIQCTHCERHMGIAMVGVEGVNIEKGKRQYCDPEMTASEFERLASFEPVSYDDVLDAHAFFTNLGSMGYQQLAERMRQLETTPEVAPERH